MVFISISYTHTHGCFIEYQLTCLPFVSIILSQNKIYGGNGALGREMIHTFNTHRWNTVSVDYTTNEDASLHVNINESNRLGDMQIWKQSTLEILNTLSLSNI